MSTSTPAARPGGRQVRFWILAVLFVVTTVNYADRSSLAVASPALRASLGIDSVQLGYIFSAFGWSYVAAQLPGGALLDRFGSRRVYLASIFAWSTSILLVGAVSLLTAGRAAVALFALWLVLGAVEAPSFPANARLVAAWFPDRERGTASAVFNAAQYAALIVFAPLMGWIVQHLGWRDVFLVMGVAGMLGGAVFARVVYAPMRHPRVSRAELDLIVAGGAQSQLDAGGVARRTGFSRATLRALLTNRMFLGIYLGQYCITALTFFFTTWFPIYLIQARHLSYTQAGFGAALPALAGVVGGLGGGVFSDRLIRRGHSLTFSRKLPIVLGMTCATSIILCDVANGIVEVLLLMALAFFGKGVGALGWAVVSDTAPREAVGLAGAMFNMFGNMAGIVTPIVIGYIVHRTGSFDIALAFVAAHALAAAASYLFVVGPIRRFSLPPQAVAARQAADRSSPATTP